MKFSRTFQESLEKGEYPQQWVDSAISYRKLKKCIKRVQEELQSLGLDRKTLEAVWQQVGTLGANETASTNDRVDQPIKYSVPERDELVFTPKLTIAIDPVDGSPVDAWLSDDTRIYLRNLAKMQGFERRRSVISLESNGEQSTAELNKTTSGVESIGQSSTGGDSVEAVDQVETIEIPLTSDSEFFQILSRELASLEDLQQVEQERLRSQIQRLGAELASLKANSSKKSKATLDSWRQIFRMYTESQIFISSNEQDAGSRDAETAQNQLQLFSRALATEKNRGLKLDQNASIALDHFMEINANLLRFVKYQEINRTALSKILKKFDKQTALRAQISNSKWLTSAPFMGRDLAKATCFTISEELLQMIPQLDDYLCPICFSVSFKPIRLRCKHVFCIRCLIVMQRAEQDHCPLCRDKSVLDASSDNLDTELLAFLKKNFPKEVKAKQKANETAAGIDRFGEDFVKTHPCTIM